MSREYRDLLVKGVYEGDAETKIMPPNVGGMTHMLRVAGARSRSLRSRSLTPRTRKRPRVLKGSIFDVYGNGRARPPKPRAPRKPRSK